MAIGEQGRPQGGRRMVVFLGLVMLVVWGLGTANFARGCSGDADDEMVIVPGGDVRADMMFEDSLESLSEATSLSYMYMTGIAWSAGDVVLPDRVNRRVIVGAREVEPEYEFREVGGETWWRVRGGDGWHTEEAPDLNIRVIDPLAILPNVSVLAEESMQLKLTGQQRVTTPLGTTLNAHHIEGRVTVKAIRRMGLGTVGNPDDDRLVRFDFLIDQETGLPVRVVFHGVPPVMAPLGILHLFEIGKLGPDAIVRPPPESLAVNLSRERSGRQMNDDSSPGAAAEVVDAVHAGGVSPEDNGEGQTRSAGATDGLEGESGRDLYLESTTGTREGWERHVAPTEGYSIETPGGWTAVADEAYVEGEGLRMSGPDGWELRVQRVAGRLSLLELGQLRLDELAGVVPGTQDISMSVETAGAGDAMRLVYEHASPSRRVIEYIIVRAPMGEGGLGYILTFSGGPVVGEDERVTLAAEIFETFRLLGVSNGH